MLLTGLAGPANAETVTVESNGSPDLSKMVVKNGRRVSVPRSCLDRLTNKLKAYTEQVASATPGQAGWSPWVARG